MPYLFNYGSNNPAQLKKRLGYMPTSVRAYLLDHWRVFRGWSMRWGCGVASLEKQEGETVYGYVSFVTEEDLVVLDKFEGVASGKYVRQVKRVELTDANDSPAFVYVSTSREHNEPSREYLEACAETISSFWSSRTGKKVTWKDIPTKNPSRPIRNGLVKMDAIRGDGVEQQISYELPDDIEVLLDEAADAGEDTEYLHDCAIAGQEQLFSGVPLRQTFALGNMIIGVRLLREIPGKKTPVLAELYQVLQQAFYKSVDQDMEKSAWDPRWYRAPNWDNLKPSKKRWIVYDTDQEYLSMRCPAHTTVLQGEFDAYQYRDSYPPGRIRAFDQVVVEMDLKSTTVEIEVDFPKGHPQDRLYAKDDK